MKNWLLALSGFWARAMDTAPRTCGSLGEFRLEVGEVGTAGAATGRIAALRHEPGDHAVEYDPVVKAAFGELGNALDMPGGKVGAKADDDVSTGGQSEGQAIGVGHGRAPWRIEGKRAM